MKKQIRTGVFETNSSSTHTLTICTKKEFEDWKNGKLRLEKWTDKFIPTKTLTVTEEDLIKYYNTYIKKTFYKDYKDLSIEDKKIIEYKYIKEHYEVDDTSIYSTESYEEWCNDGYLETFVDSYTTEHGDEIVVFGKYGYDG